MTKRLSVFFLLSLYLTWYAVFESFDLPLKIDTHIHVFRVLNLIESFKQGVFFPSWHNSPYWGYPEDFNFILSYLLASFLGFIFPIAIAFKISFVSFYLAAALSAEWCITKITEDKSVALMGALLYVGSASFANFGLGSGSLPRIAGYAFYPLMLGQFIKWWITPSRNEALKASLAFFLAYLAHPIAALSGVMSLPFVGLLIKSEDSFRWHLKVSWKAFCLGALLFSWPLSQLLFSKGLSSWNEVYAFYAQFRLHFFLKSFFGFWMNDLDKTRSFYMGAFPLILTLLGFRRTNKFALGLAVAGFLIILFGQTLIEKNTYRFDLLYNLGVATCAAILLSKIKWKKLSYLILGLIIFEQTYLFRTFGGRDYISDSQVQKLKTKIGEKLKAPRVLLSELGPFQVMTQTQWDQLSPNQWLEFHGVLEITPYNLGILPFEKINLPKLFTFLGIPEWNDPTSYQTFKTYDSYHVIQARNRRESYKSFDFTPMVFKQNNEDPSITQVNAPLTVIYEAYHPRRSIPGYEVLVVEPGLMAIEGKVSGDLKIEDHFTNLEVISGLLTLLTFITIIGLLIIKRRFKVSLP